MLLWLPPLDPALATAAIVLASVPMLSVYDKETGLPLLPWSEKAAVELVGAA